MRYAAIKYNDIVDCDNGICVSFWTQGCPFHCFNCHNPETWDYDGGYEFTEDTMNTILESINKNGINRHFSILGGEPLCQNNLELTYYVIKKVREKFPNIKIFLWTGYTYEYLLNSNIEILLKILYNIDILIDGQYKDELRDITLKLRGSSNQRVIDVKSSLINNDIVLY